MSQVTPAQPSENETTSNSTGKGPMSGNKNTLSHGAKSLQNSPGRGSATGGSANQTGTEEASNSKLRNSSIRRSSIKPPNTNLSLKAQLPPTINVTKTKNQFITKKKEYTALKDELAEKEKCARTLFADLTDLREKLLANNVKDPGQIEGLKFEVGPSILAGGHANFSTNEDILLSVAKKRDTMNKILEGLKCQLQEMHRRTREICQDVLEKHSSLVTFVFTRVANQSELEDEESGNDNADIAQHMRIHQKNNEVLKSKVEEVKAVHIEVELELTKNIAELFDDHQHHRSHSSERDLIEDAKVTRTQLDNVMGELQKEREDGGHAKERLRQMDVLLERARAKNRELEAHIASDQTKMQQLQDKMKSMDQQIKTKNQLMDQRMKAMQKTAKNNESLMARVEKQRDSFESRLLELKQEMNIKEGEAIGRIKEISNELELATANMDAEKEKRQEMENELANFKERYANLEEKCQELCELAEKNKHFPVSDGNHTEGEMRLFNDLQTTRAELEKQKEKMAQLQQEKDEIVAVMHQAANRDDESDTNNKLAAELVCKSSEFQNLMAQFNDLKKVAKNAQERNGTLEKQLRDLQLGLHAQMVEGGKSTINAHTIELQQQVSDLRNNLVEALRQKEELESVLTQKQLELEQRDQVLRDQTKFLKIRDEMLGLMKDQQGNGEASNPNDNTDEVDQIAVKREAIQELYKTITNKQLQVLRLEKMVKLMEDQQDRAQAQRTRFENRIAQLELALQKNKEQRSKGFGIL